MSQIAFAADLQRREVSSFLQQRIQNKLLSSFICACRFSSSGSLHAIHPV